jgi:predicted kinase
MNTSAHETQPLLIIVNGPPASGKSTLAEQIAAEMRLPYISKDALKEELFDSLGVIERTISRKLGETSMRLMYTAADRILEAGIGVVIEANFYRGLSEQDLSPRIARAHAVVIHCDAPDEIIKDRYVERAEAGERHPVHDDNNRVEDLDEHLEGGTFDPLDLDIPMIRVDTTNGFAPSAEEIVSQIRTGMPATRGV